MASSSFEWLSLYHPYRLPTILAMGRIIRYGPASCSRTRAGEGWRTTIVPTRLSFVWIVLWILWGGLSAILNIIVVVIVVLVVVVVIGQGTGPGGTSHVNAQKGSLWWQLLLWLLLLYRCGSSNCSLWWYRHVDSIFLW